MVKRTYIPGSEWLYIKIYMAQEQADAILVSHLYPLIKKMEKSKYIAKWFFVRYYEVDFHIRLRVYLLEKRFLGDIMELLKDKLERMMKDKLIWKVQFDTYNRELERYEKNLIEEAESIFTYDSECVISILKQFEANPYLISCRWLIALKLMDELLGCFDMETEEKYVITNEISSNLKKEYAMEGPYLKQFNSKYVKNRMLVEDMLNGGEKKQDFLMLDRVIDTRTCQIKKIAEIIYRKKKDRSVIKSLLRSYIHMSINRFFISDNRVYEMFLTDFLARYYRGKIYKCNKSL